MDIEVVISTVTIQGYCTDHTDVSVILIIHTQYCAIILGVRRTLIVYVTLTVCGPNSAAEVWLPTGTWKLSSNLQGWLTLLVLTITEIGCPAQEHGRFFR